MIKYILMYSMKALITNALMLGLEHVLFCLCVLNCSVIETDISVVSMHISLHCT